MLGNVNIKPAENLTVGKNGDSDFSLLKVNLQHSKFKKHNLILIFSPFNITLSFGSYINSIITTADLSQPY